MSREIELYNNLEKHEQILVKGIELLVSNFREANGLCPTIRINTGSRKEGAGISEFTDITITYSLYGHE